ncbi:hypothetical protein ANN_22283 [Periplaneta americana]|uniref:Uncharacterized protein n=1 Tax=Periplaneta americana TaxID=6978 RepID=A0ABQ8S7Q0_PERAM|nr:hypothetical protein ANN_22283 [Periplaneta americana]
MNPEFSAESYSAFAFNRVKENPEKPQPGNLSQLGFELETARFTVRHANRYSTAVATIPMLCIIRITTDCISLEGATLDRVQASDLTAMQHSDIHHNIELERVTSSSDTRVGGNKLNNWTEDAVGCGGSSCLCCCGYSSSSSLTGKSLKWDSVTEVRQKLFGAHKKLKEAMIIEHLLIDNQSIHPSIHPSIHQSILPSTSTYWYNIGTSSEVEGRETTRSADGVCGEKWGRISDRTTTELNFRAPARTNHIPSSLSFRIDLQAMLGKQSGVAQKFSSQYPNIIIWHCMNHRLELALADAIDEVGGVNHFQIVLDKLYTLYSRSPMNQRQLAECAVQLDQAMNKIACILTTTVESQSKQASLVYRSSARVCVRNCISIRRPEFECSGPQLEGPEFECSGPQLEGPEFEYSELSLKVCGSRYCELDWLFNDAVSTTRLFSVDEIGDSEMVFDEMRPRIRHRLPSIHLTVGENLGKNPTRIDVIAINRNKQTAEIIDPTIRFEISATQPSEVNEEQKKIYEPTIQYLSAKYNIEKITVTGLFFGARGTIPKAFVKWREKYKLMRDLQDAIVTTIIKFSVAIFRQHLYDVHSI